MQLNLKIRHLLFDLSEIESSANRQYLIGDGTVLRNNLLKLYRATSNEDSQELIIRIMNEAGYSWFEKMVRSDLSARLNRDFTQRSADSLSVKLEIMSEYEFLSLLPANELIH